MLSTARMHINLSYIIIQLPRRLQLLWIAKVSIPAVFLFGIVIKRLPSDYRKGGTYSQIESDREQGAEVNASVCT